VPKPMQREGTPAPLPILQIRRPFASQGGTYATMVPDVGKEVGARNGCEA
jgi:hypothetical protein